MNKSKFQFSNPELEEINFLINKNFDQKMYDGIAMQCNTEVKTIDNNLSYVALTLDIGNSSESQPFIITVKMSAKFTWEESLVKDRVQNMLNINAPAVLLSYIRPIVSSMTGSSRYPALNIPFVDFSKNN